MLAVFLICALSAVAGVALGAPNLVRTQDAQGTMTSKVGGLYGSPQTQVAPRFEYTGLEGTRTLTGALEVTSTDISADFKLDQRQKGLLWFATYKVDFAAAYGVISPTARPGNATMPFQFPSRDALYDGFAVRVDGREQRIAAVMTFSHQDEEPRPGCPRTQLSAIAKNRVSQSLSG